MRKATLRMCYSMLALGFQLRSELVSVSLQHQQHQLWHTSGPVWVSLPTVARKGPVSISSCKHHFFACSFYSVLTINKFQIIKFSHNQTSDGAALTSRAIVVSYADEISLFPIKLSATMPPPLLLLPTSVFVVAPPPPPKTFLNPFYRPFHTPPAKDYHKGTAQHSIIA
jgi:hypothetical protein